VFTPANVLRSSGPCSRSWFTASSSSGAARDVARSSPGTSSARRCGRVLPWDGAAAAPSPAPSHGALTDGVERENPNRVGGGGQLALRLPPPALLNPGAARAGRNPYAAPAWTARAPVAALPSLSARARSQGRGVGVKEDFPPSARVRFARGRGRSLGVRVAWLARPSHRALPPVRCGSVDPPPGAGKGGKGMRGRGKQWLTGGPYPAASQARKGRRGGCLVAGPAR
jgi:hypothetical protein